MSAAASAAGLPDGPAALERRIARAALANARAGREAAAVGPFVALADLTSTVPWASLAVPAPDAPADTDWCEALPALEAHFAARGRALRFEFLEGLFPSLGPALERAGWPLASRDPLFVCGPDALAAPGPVAGFSLEALDASSADDLLERFLGVQHDAFEADRVREPSAGERDQLRTRLRLGFRPIAAFQRNHGRTV